MTFYVFLLCFIRFLELWYGYVGWRKIQRESSTNVSWHVPKPLSTPTLRTTDDVNVLACRLVVSALRLSETLSQLPKGSFGCILSTEVFDICLQWTWTVWTLNSRPIVTASICTSICCDWLIDWLIDWFIHSFIDWLSGWLFNRLTCRYIPVPQVSYSS